MIVLDASVLIAYLDGANTHHDRAAELLAREIEDDFGANALSPGTAALVLPIPQYLPDKLESVLPSGKDQYLSEGQRVRPEIILDLACEQFSSTIVVGVRAIEIRDKNAGIEHDHAGHSSRSVSR